MIVSTIKIKKPGPLTTVQDKGRYGYQKFGMPVAGVMDGFSFKMANLLLGNGANDAVLEFTFQGPEIEFTEDNIIAITGANAQPKINGRKVSMWRTLYVTKGSLLSFSGLKSGFRGYIAFKGGIDLPQVMGSRSTYLRGSIGGYEGRKLKEGDLLKTDFSVDKQPSFKVRRLPDIYIPQYKDKKIRVIMGPQDDYFTAKGIKQFLTEEYRITSQADRMGYRLKGPVIEHKKGADIISDGIAPGAIQVPGHGNPIIMLADRQTTGGYTKIASVISVDLNKLVQMKPGRKICFEKISIEKAHKLLEKQNKISDQIKETDVRYGSSKKFKIRVNGQEFETELKEIIEGEK